MQPYSLPLRAAAYIRSCSNCPDELASQEEAIRRAVARNGDMLDERFVFRDVATGPNPVTDYPALTRFLDAVRLGVSMCSRFYVRDITRLGRFRNPEDLWALCTLLDGHGVEVYAVDSQRPYVGWNLADASIWKTPNPARRCRAGLTHRRT